LKEGSLVNSIQQDGVKQIQSDISIHPIKKRNEDEKNSENSKEKTADT